MVVQLPFLVVFFGVWKPIGVSWVHLKKQMVLTYIVIGMGITLSFLTILEASEFVDLED